MAEPPVLSADDIARVRRSFDRLWPVSSQTTEAFYRHLFEVAPEIRSLFRSDMAEQQRKFIGTLATIVGNLDNGVAASMATRLGQNHRDYGVRPQHYAVVGKALLWTLEDALGEDWTPAMATSWSRAYTYIAGHMLKIDKS